MVNREIDKWIARNIASSGFEMTPDEVRQDIHSIAEKFRKTFPEMDLSDDDDECIHQVIRDARIDFVD